jgi:hypothetical protein
MQAANKRSNLTAQVFPVPHLAVHFDEASVNCVIWPLIGWCCDARLLLMSVRLACWDLPAEI